MQTIFFKNKPRMIATGSIAGPKECEGVVGRYVDKTLLDDMFGESTYEKAECKMLTYAISKTIENAGMDEKQVDMLISGDLLNQIISASFAARDFDFPFLGVYGACSTLAESYALAATLVDGGYAKKVVAATGSHFSSAERQYRYPLELGNTRPPQAQWTVTGAGGAFIADMGSVNDGQNYPAITCATIGKVVDFGVTDVNNMGAAMAPAAADTLLRCYAAENNPLCDADLIVTGDLGFEGSEILRELMVKDHPEVGDKLTDCGMLIYDRKVQDVHGGGSGCGCSAVMLSAHFLPMLERGEIKKMIFMATGAMMSPMTLLQGEAIPGVAHLLVLESPLAQK